MTARQQRILTLLLHQGAATYQAIADVLKVSTMTVRRDADDLVRRGLVLKIIGGIQHAGAPASLYETDLRSRLNEQRREKHAIALRALELVQDHQTLFVDGGTTCLEFAKLLATRRHNLTIVTNSALACLELGRGDDNMIVAIGGQYDSSNMSFVGPTSEDAASRFFVDLAFISTKGFVPAEGTFESVPGTFHIKQVIARQAARVVLLVDHSKFGRRALSKVLDTSAIHCVVTDDKVARDHVAALRERGCETILAEAATVVGDVYDHA